jgi:putative tricarboxylic transport membrane protein
MSPGPGARRDRWSAAGLAVIAAAYLAVNLRYSLDTLAAPGPGVFPLAAGVALLGLAGGLAIFPARDPDRELKVSGSRRRTPLLMIGLLALYVGALGVLGFLASSFVLVLLTARLMGATGWRRPAVLALGVTVASYVVFVIWLGVPLPAGWFG